MTPKRACEIGQAMSTKTGHGPDTTEEASEALALLWGQLNRARTVIEDLKEELDEREWTFEDGGWKGGEGVFCQGCGARGPAGHPPAHQLTCPWKQAIEDAEAFLARFG